MSPFQEEIDTNCGLMSVIVENVEVYSSRRTDLRNYLHKLAASYSNRHWIIDAVRYMLIIHAPREKEWFEKILMLQS